MLEANGSLTKEKNLRSQILTSICDQQFYVQKSWNIFTVGKISVTATPFAELLVIVIKRNTQALIEQLTPREMEVTTLMAQGLSDEQIRDKLAIAKGTLDTHKKRIFEKLEVKDRRILMALFNPIE